MIGVTKLDRIRSERIEGTTKVGEISKKVGCSQESDGDGGGGEKKGGRPKRRWLDNINNDLSERELSGEEAQDRVNGGVS